MSEKMMPYDMMKSQYNNKYGMNDNKMDMNKFEKMFEMISEMKTQKKQYEAPVPGSRTDMRRSLMFAMRLPPPFLRSLTSKRLSRETSEPSTWDKSRASWDVARMPSKSCA